MFGWFKRKRTAAPVHPLDTPEGASRQTSARLDLHAPGDLALRMDLSPENVPDIEPGQSWRLRHAPSGAMRAVVGRVDPWGPRGLLIVHVSLFHGPAYEIGGGATRDDIAHMPFTLQAFRASLERLDTVGAKPHADFEEGYLTWLHAASEGKAGVFSEPVMEALYAALGLSSRERRAAS